MKSLRLERYPFCARGCLTEKKKERKKLGENWMVNSIESYCSGLLSNHNVFLCFQFNSSSCRCYRISFPRIVFFAHVCSETRSSSPQKEAYGILMTVNYFTNINSQRLNSKLGIYFLKSTWNHRKQFKFQWRGRGGYTVWSFNWSFSIIKIILSLLQSRYNSVNLTICIDCCLSSAVYLTIPD